MIHLAGQSLPKGNKMRLTRLEQGYRILSKSDKVADLTN